MCGIAGIHIKQPGVIKSQEGFETFVDKLLLGIERRGKDSTGFVATTFGKNRKTVMDKDALTASDFIKTRDRLPENIQTILLHTRAATQGAASDHRNNHPVLTKTCFAVHNGHINNDDEIFKQYNLTRTGEVDSEAISAIADHVGLDDPQEFLSKLEGYMATAIIDPVNFPGRLVLAKGVWSPLVSFENDKFLIWASEVSALKDAWSAVLGTPPQYNKFHHWKEGDLWVYDDASKQELTFQPIEYVSQKSKKRQIGYGAYGTPPETQERSKAPHWFRDAGTETQRAVVTPRSDLDDNTKRELAVKAIVRAARSQGLDWIQCPTLSESNEATKKELREMFGVTELKWQECPGCNTWLVSEFFRKTLNWGTICVDCREGNVKYYQRRAELAGEQDEKDTKVQWIDPETIKKLEHFVGIETELHAEALVAVSDEADVDVAIIDWLIFRAPDSYLTDHAILADVASEFDGMYQEFLATLWEEKNAQDNKEDGAVLGYCTDHGQYYDKEANCQECVLDSAWAASRDRDQQAAAFPTVGGVGIEASLAVPATTMKVCECGKFTTDTTCITCKNGLENEELNPTPHRRALAPGPQPVGLPPIAEKVCVTCGAGAEFIVPKSKFAWCVDCFCGCDGIDDGRSCQSLSNHTRADGVRVCHAHARGVSGVTSDTHLEKRYGKLVEVGRH